MQPEVFSREYIKPSTSTPQNHPTVHNLSIFDKLQYHVYMSLLFFYTSRDGDTDPNLISSLLKSSLSTALSHYYPLAGRIKDDATVDCNDEGALFLEAQMECHLSEILANPEDDSLRLLCPDSLCYEDSTKTGPVAVQVTYFKGGGMSIGICLCHRVMDMATMSSFINDWASLARKPDTEIITPEFNIGSLYSHPVTPFENPTDVGSIETKDLVWRRLVFCGSKIADLKSMVADQAPNPTRVEVVAALVHKSAVNAVARASSSGMLKSSAMNHAMNLRTHVTPQLSNRNKGNMVGVFHVLTPEDKGVTLEWLVKEFRHSKSRYSKSFANAGSGEEVHSIIHKNAVLRSKHEVYICTSWCRNRFYEPDFGWGKPIWIAPPPYKAKNLVFLLDTREGDGIEAYVCLEDEVMAAFEQDEQLVSFCSINPSIEPRL